MSRHRHLAGSGNRRWLLPGSAGLLLAANAVSLSAATVTLIKDDFATWESAAGAISTCDFTGFPEWTVITDQYGELGALFTGPAPNLIHHSTQSYSQDEWGLDANGVLEVTFLEPVHAVAGHGPGKWKYKLYLADSLVGETSFYLGGPGDFAGAISDVAFDRVRFEPAQFNGIMFMDNVYFATIPAPAGLVVVLCGPVGLMRGGQRRRVSLRTRTPESEQDGKVGTVDRA